MMRRRLPITALALNATLAAAQGTLDARGGSSAIPLDLIIQGGTLVTRLPQARHA